MARARRQTTPRTRVRSTRIRPAPAADDRQEKLPPRRAARRVPEQLASGRMADDDAASQDAGERTAGNGGRGGRAGRVP